MLRGSVSAGFPPARRLAVPTALFFAFAVTVSAQPIIYSRSVYNAASYMPSGIPGGAIARGSIFTVFGSGIGPSTPAQATTFPLGTSLGGVALNVVQGSTTVSAIPLYVSASQINAIMPSNAPLGTASLQVVMGNFRSNMTPIRIANSAFGIVSALGTGSGPGVLQNFITGANQPINSPTVTAQIGQVITLWGTGLGPVTGGDNVAPAAANLPTKVEVFVGGVSAPLLYSGRAPCCAGTDQIAFQVPDNAPSGCWVPVYVRTEGTNISNFVTMAIQPSGGVCTTDVLPQIGSSVVSGGKRGGALVLRATTHQDVGVRAAIDATADYHFSAAFQYAAVPFPFNPSISTPPAGTCTVYTLQGDMLNGDPLPDAQPAPTALDLGPALMLNGPNGSRTLSYLTVSGVRGGYLGGMISNNILPSSLFLDPGTYTLRGLGGLNVGTFTTTLTIPSPLTWTNRDQLLTVDRTKPLAISWTGGGTGQVVAIVGVGEDLPTNSSAAFACVAPPGASSFSVPPDILANLPATRPNPLQSKDVIYLVTMAGAQNLNATGLDAGISAYSSVNGKTVVLQ